MKYLAMCKVYTDVGDIKYLYHVCQPYVRESTRNSSWIITTYRRTTHGITITCTLPNLINIVPSLPSLLTHKKYSFYLLIKEKKGMQKAENFCSIFLASIFEEKTVFMKTLSFYHLFILTI